MTRWLARTPATIGVAGDAFGQAENTERERLWTVNASRRGETTPCCYEHLAERRRRASWREWLSPFRVSVATPGTNGVGSSRREAALLHLGFAGF
ncbi:hypothetical protein VIGAN_01282300 [Vigna angularis var. angularis]|uniref:Uncharacterized protein n=1 Tax=Vigna angularis var. angularis TaxID=157739 RepID=A0A0S3R3A6_PHAAN|nr:hypothetical protein VIGAN_01282300 [Vigna angularis var. angularis]